jgi:F-type H+-transporting ATPase subunit gamma
MESIEEIKARLDNIRGLEPIFVALRTIALSSRRAALRRLEHADLYYAHLARVHTVLVEHLAPDKPRGHKAEHKPCGRCALLIVGNQRGLCGPFASTVASAAQQTLRELQASQESAGIELMVLGTRARREVHRLGLQTTWEGTLPVTSVPPLELATELAAMGMRRYEAGELDAFYAVYNHYLGGGSYEPRVITLIPVSTPARSEEEFPWPPPILETDIRSLYRRVIVQLTELSFYSALLQSTAAEQSARFQLMEGASDNSRHLIEELTLTYHTARQEAVTAEMLELAVSAGLIRSDEA